MQRLMLVLASVGIASAAGAQIAPLAVDPAALEAKMTAAMASANRPGDEGLGCDAIQKELIAKVKDPAVQATVARQGAYAQQQIAKLNEASAATSGSVAAQMAMGFASAFTPALGGVLPGVGSAAALSAQAGQMRAMQAQAAANQQMMMAQMQEMVTIMPHLMRSYRLVELASNRKCEWAPAVLPPIR